MTFLFVTLSRFSQFPTYKRAIGMGEALAQMGHVVKIACLDCEENRSRMALEAPHCEPIWIKTGSLWKEVVGKLSAVWSVKPDFVYSPSYSLRNLAFLRWMFPRRVKLIIEFCELYSDFARKLSCWRMKEYLALSEADYLVCASHYLRKEFSRRIQSRRLKLPVLYLPYAYPEYLKSKGKVQNCPQRVLFMAALWRNYGIYEVLSATEMLLQRGRNIVLDVLGSGPEKLHVIQWVKEHCLDERIHIHGYVDESRLDEYFSEASVFVSPMQDTIQDWARCPSKLFYYLPYNKPIVTCQIGDPYCTLGALGFYYSPLNVEEMANAIDNALLVAPTFSYPEGFVEKHSWASRAKEIMDWLQKGAVNVD